MNPIIWYEIAKATYEVNNSTKFFGKHIKTTMHGFDRFGIFLEHQQKIIRSQRRMRSERYMKLHLVIKMIVTEGNRYVAFFDILGFKNWVETEGSWNVFVYIRGFMNLMIRASMPKRVVNADMSVDLEPSIISYINFFFN